MVTLGDRRTVEDTLTGDIDIIVEHEGAKTRLRLTNVMFIKDLDVILISTAVLDENNIHTTLSKGTCIIITVDVHNVLCRAKKSSDGLYELHATRRL